MVDECSVSLPDLGTTLYCNQCSLHISVVILNCRLYSLVKYSPCISYRPITKHMCTLTLMPHTCQIVPVFVPFIL